MKNNILWIMSILTMSCDRNDFVSNEQSSASILGNSSTQTQTVITDVEGSRDGTFTLTVSGKHLDNSIAFILAGEEKEKIELIRTNSITEPETATYKVAIPSKLQTYLGRVIQLIVNDVYASESGFVLQGSSAYLKRDENGTYICTKPDPSRPDFEDCSTNIVPKVENPNKLESLVCIGGTCSNNIMPTISDSGKQLCIGSPDFCTDDLTGPAGNNGKNGTNGTDGVNGKDGLTASIPYIKADKVCVGSVGGEVTKNSEMCTPSLTGPQGIPGNSSSPDYHLSRNNNQICLSSTGKQIQCVDLPGVCTDPGKCGLEERFHEGPLSYAVGDVADTGVFIHEKSYVTLTKGQVLTLKLKPGKVNFLELGWKLIKGNDLTCNIDAKISIKQGETVLWNNDNKSVNVLSKKNLVSWDDWILEDEMYYWSVFDLASMDKTKSYVDLTSQGTLEIAYEKSGPFCWSDPEIRFHKTNLDYIAQESQPLIK